MKSEFLQQLEAGLQGVVSQQICLTGYQATHLLLKQMQLRPVECWLRLKLRTANGEREVEVKSCNGHFSANNSRGDWIFKHVTDPSEAVRRLVRWVEDNLKY